MAPRKTYHYKGTQYQSKGEYEIAQFLNDMNIEFEYEFPVAIVDEGKTKIWYPDFYLKEYQIVIEYFGMYNYNEEYKESVERKKEVFKSCGIQFLPIYELNRNWKEYTLKTILQHLEFKTYKMSKKLDKLEKKHSKFTDIIKNILYPKEKKRQQKKLVTKRPPKRKKK